MMRKTALAVLLTVGFLVSPGTADFIVYAPGSPVDPPPLAVSAVPGHTVNIPIYLTGTGETVGVDVEIMYDITKLHLPSYEDCPNVTVGSLNGSWSKMANTLTDGDAFITTSGSAKITNPSGGTVLNVLFQVDFSASLGPTTIQLINYVPRAGFTMQDGSINIVPEPSSLACLVSLLVAAGPVVFWWRRRASRG